MQIIVHHIHAHCTHIHTHMPFSVASWRLCNYKIICTHKYCLYSTYHKSDNNNNNIHEKERPTQAVKLFGLASTVEQCSSGSGPVQYYQIIIANKNASYIWEWLLLLHHWELWAFKIVYSACKSVHMLMNARDMLNYWHTTDFFSLFLLLLKCIYIYI